MKLLTKLGLGAGAVALGLVGAIKVCEVYGGVEKETRAVEIKMVPKSVAIQNYGGFNSTTALAIFGGVNGKPLLAYNNQWTMDAAKIKALIDAEINDGDNEAVTLRGSYDRSGTNFSLYGVKVNGYKFGY